ncbi:MAG TPA: aspartyl/asparaginyl beta-hydroxylase domain-containing protein [Acidimicrobiales bacterium]
MSGPDRARLPLRFDAAALAAEAAALPADAWVPHFNTRQYEGDWSGVALRAPVGGLTPLYPDPAAEAFEPTEALAACPRTAEALAAFPCPVTTARFLRLGPGSRITEHRDHKLSVPDGEARLHVPLTTGPGVTFLLDGRPVDMAAGECWYLDLTRRHAVTNEGDRPRVHLVVDCVADDWLARIVQTGP